MDRLIFHVDVNSAYLSWEAAYKVSKGEEDIRLIPSAIGGDKEKRTGVILAKSIPAKEYNIRTGEPVSMALRKCPQLYLAKPNFMLYEKSSKAFMDICREYAPIVEKYSIDECFLDMSGTNKIYINPIETAYEIKNKIRSELGFTVNIGIGPNKILAKMASDFEKPDKIHTLFLNEIEDKLWPLPVSNLFSVGKSISEKLINAKIFTIGDLAHCNLEKLKYTIGNKVGQQIFEYANGIDNDEVSKVPEAAKGYSTSTTLEADVTNFQYAQNIILALTDSVATRMRADNAKAYCIGLNIRTNTFLNKSHQKNLTIPTDITDEIFEIAKTLFHELWDKRTPLRLIGISLTNICRTGEEQLSMFPDESKKKSQKIDRTIDAIRNKFGSDTITRGASYNSTLNIGKKYKAHIDTNIKK